MTEPPARVFLVERDQVLRGAMHRTLDAYAPTVVVGEASGAADAAERLPGARAHVAVVGGVPEREAAAVCRLVRAEHREVALLVRTSEASDGLLRAVRGGVFELVSEEARVVDFLRALDRVVEQRSTALTWGGGELDEADLRLLGRLPASVAGALSSLSPQERRVLELYAEGLDEQQIGEQLFLARRTVRSCLDSIGRKLGWTDEPDR